MSATNRARNGVANTSLVRGAIFGAVRDGAAGQTFRKPLHVLVSAAADQPAELIGCERETRIIINRAPHSRTEEPSNQASQPPHVNSLAPATNLLVRILFLPHDRDCKRPQGPRTKNFSERIISSSPRQSADRANRQSRRSVRTPRCPRDPSERNSRQSCRRDIPSRHRS